MTEQRPSAQARPLLSRSGLWALIVGTGFLLLVLLPFAQGRLHKAMEFAPSSLSIRYLALSVDQRPDDLTLRMTLVDKLTEVGQLDEAHHHLSIVSKAEALEEDPTLRMVLARKLVDIGDADDARHQLSVLAAAEGPQRDAARRMMLDLDLRAWEAIDPTRQRARAAALKRVLADLRVFDLSRAPPAEVQRFAKLYLRVGQPLAAAELLDTLAAHGRTDVEARIDAADAAWVAAGRPDRAAEVRAQAAARPGQTTATGTTHARLALERVRGTGDPDAVVRMLERMRALYPKDTALLALAVRVEEEHDVQRAYALAQQLVRLAPSEARHHRQLARLAEATGRSLRALDEYVWLVRHGGTRADRARALALAKANWDLRLYRQLLDGGGQPKAPKPARVCKDGKGCDAPRRAPATRAPRTRGPHSCQSAPRHVPTRATTAGTARGPPPSAQPAARAVRALHERVALDEALGDPATARARLARAVNGDYADVEALWQRKLDLELREGDTTAALQTATDIAHRFPGRAASERVAHLQLSLGDPRAALATLRDAELRPGERDAGWLRRLAVVASEAGDLDAERAAYAALVASPHASAWDFQRLYALSPDRPSALRVALAAFDRFQSPAMLFAAIDLHAADGRDDELMALLDRAAHVKAVARNPQYWQARIGWQQRRVVRAIERRAYATARRELATSERLLDTAAEKTPNDTDAYAPLWSAQHAQALSLGLASDDTALVAAAYPHRADALSVRQRVYVLRRLGRDDEALAMARDALRREDLSSADRRALESDVRDLGRDIRRFVALNGGTLVMDGLLELQSEAEVAYADAPQGLAGRASFTHYRPRATAVPVLTSNARDVAAALDGRLGVVTLGLGARVRDERSVRPFGGLAVQLFGRPDDGMRASLRVNDTTADTTRLRVLGARDTLGLDLALRLHEHVYWTARSAAELYYVRQDRSYLGAGYTLDTGIGLTTEAPADLGTAQLRLVGRLAPRFAKRDSQPSGTAPEPEWLPETTEWLGIGPALGRGRLDAPPLVGRSFGYLVDGAVGWLWNPSPSFGYSANAAFGTSVIGADMLSLAGRVGNVLGSTVWSMNLGYAYTFDR